MNNKIKNYKDLPDSFLTDVTDKEIDAGVGHTKMQSMTLEDGLSDGPKVNAEETYKQQTHQTGSSMYDEDGDTSDRLALEGLVDGRLILDIVDGFMAACVVWIVALFFWEVKRKDMRLTESEKETLEPVVEKCLATINWNFKNAWTLLGVSLLFIYAGKAVDTATKKERKVKPNTSRPTKDGTVEDADTVNPQDRAQEIKEKQMHRHASQQEMTIDLEAQQQPAVIYYSPEEVADIARQRRTSKARTKQQLANGNRKKGIKTVFTAGEKPRNM